MPATKANRASVGKGKMSAWDVHVRDCMVWPDPTRRFSDPEQRTTTYVRIKKGEVGRPNVRGFELDVPARVCLDPQDNDHVIDALRGWPGSKVKFVEEVDLQEDTKLEHEAKKSRKKCKKTNKKVTIESLDGDAHIADLISHRFLSDAVRARQEEENRKLRATLAQAKKERERRLPTSIKTTKASQLRSIAMAERVDNSPMELWQMPRFKRNARPFVDTYNVPQNAAKSAPAQRRVGDTYTGYNSYDYGIDESPLKYTSDREGVEVGYPPLSDPPGKTYMDDDYFHKYPQEEGDMFGASAEDQKKTQEIINSL